MATRVSALQASRPHAHTHTFTAATRARSLALSHTRVYREAIVLSVCERGEKRE